MNTRERFAFAYFHEPNFNAVCKRLPEFSERSEHSEQNGKGEEGEEVHYGKLFAFTRREGWFGADVLMIRHTFHKHVHEELSGTNYCETNEGGEKDGFIGGDEGGAWILV